MPKYIEHKIMKSFRKKGLKGKRLKKATFATMNKKGLMKKDRVQHEIDDW